MGNADSLQYGGTHYKQFQGAEPWNIITQWGLGYLDGTALKYIARWKHKNGIEDLNKAIHFLQKLVEVETARTTRQLDPRPISGHLPPMDEAARHCPSLPVASQSSNQTGHAGVNEGHFTLVACHSDYPTPWTSLFPTASAERAMERLCNLCAVDEQTGDSFPLCTGELNIVSVLRPDGLNSQYYDFKYV